MHKTFLRQLAKLGLDNEKLPLSKEQWEKIINSVSTCYTQYDEDRYLLERSLDISSTEMRNEIDRRKAMSLQLAQAGKMASLGTLASGVAHELNNPLAIILSLAEILQLSPNLDQRQKSDIARIIKVSHRMAGTIKHLLKLSRQGDGDNSTLVEIRKPINESLELLKSQFVNDNILVQLDIQENELFIYGNENALVSVFQNLLTNSRDAFIANKNRGIAPRIDIHIKEHKDNKKLSVFYTDNAGGISNEVINKIFDPFFTTKDIGIGTGLGLSISKQVIEEHRGSINVNSIEGASTRFEIIFPLAVEEQTNAKFININENPAEEITKPISSHKKILVVDDEEDICYYFQNLLSDKYAITTTSFSQNALHLIDNENFDLIITDLNMPLVCGKQLAAHIRIKQPHTKLMFISGHIDSDLTGSLNHFKPFILVEKPFPDITEFKNIISDSLS